MKVSRLLGTTAATAVLVVAPTAAVAADGNYGGGQVGPNEGSQGGGGSVGPLAGRAGTGADVSGSSASTGGLPSTGSTALDTALGGAGLALVLGGGAMVVASRRRATKPA